MSKKPASKLKLRARYDKKTDEIKQEIYDGRAKASKQQAERFIKSNFDKLKPEKLSDREQSIYRSIENNKFRIRDDKGRFVKITPDFIKKMDIDTGGLPLSQYYSKHREEFKAAQNFSRATLPITYNQEQIIKKIETYKYDITINGKPATKLQAIQKITESTEALFQAAQTAGLRWVDFKVTYTKAGTQLNIFTVSDKAEKMIQEYTRQFNLKKDKKGRDKLVEKLNKLLEKEGISIGIYEPGEDEEEELLLMAEMAAMMEKTDKILQKNPTKKKSRIKNINAKAIKKRLDKFDENE